MKQLRGSLLLFLTAFIWGIAFVAQRVGGEQLGPFSFNGIRSFIGALVLLPLVMFLNSRKSEEQKAKESRKAVIIGGIICGSVLFAATTLQQIGILYTAVGKAGFITALYIVFVPIISIVFGKRAGIKVWIAVLIALIGLYLLCMTGSFSLSRGDTLVLICAVVFSFHILAVDYFCVRVDTVLLSCIQFFTCGVLSLVPMFVLETPTLAGIQGSLMPLLYAGVMSCGIAYTLQIIGQKDVHPTAASIIMSLESVFSVLAGWVLLNQALSVRELIGCALVFGACILAQLPDKNSAPAAEN